MAYETGLDPKLKFRLYRLSAWCGIAVMVGSLFAYFILGKLFPPISPTASAEDVQQFLIDNREGILWAVVFMGLVAPLFYLFAVVTSLQMRRIEGGWGLLSMVQLTTAVVAPTGWVYPLAVLATAAYRANDEGRGEQNAELVRMLSDQYWLTYVGVAVIFVLNIASIGFAALVDRREKPVFPRWFAYLNFFLAVLFLPGVFVYVFQTGPLAWNGLFALWVPACAFPVWKIIMIWGLLRAIKQEEQEEMAEREAEEALAA